MPSNTDTYTAKDGNKAYEVWTYDGISGGVKFYFVDINQNGICTCAFHYVRNTK